MVSLGVDSYRTGVDWSRVMPRPDAFDAGAIEVYRRQMALLRERGITSAALLPARTTSAASIGGALHEGRKSGR